MNDEYDQSEYLDPDRFWHRERNIGLVLLLLIVGTVVAIAYKPPPVISDKLPTVPVYPGSTLIENTVYDPSQMVGMDPVAQLMIMEIPTDIYHYKSIGEEGDYYESFYEFVRELGKNNWIEHAGRSCPDFLWWNPGYAATWEEFSNIQDGSKVWTLVGESVPAENKKGITRLTFTVTKGYQYKGCLKVGF